jgi:FixJ family two-component response regulator
VPYVRPKIGIVDDDQLVAFALKNMLASEGYEVAAVAHTSTEAFALVEALGDSGLVFIDLWLGGTSSGVDVALQAVRNGLDVIVMTGGAQLPAELAGAGLLLKPFSVDQLNTLLHLLRRPSQGVAPPVGAIVPG